ncbi:hypothetical protein E2C01_012830 [Portunus trituberculatus]|uniref:Uncharacterized protein n=1 Tax=Portunus trituberculatus TaxID=210409 RepID=A0A5B7DFG6_PORTR|nr:hypothetical protein [Portunus trituberculatus]
MLLHHCSCNNTIIVCDLNQHLVEFMGLRGYFLGYLLSQSPPARKLLPQVRKPNLHSEPVHFLGPQSTHGSTVPQRPISCVSDVTVIEHFAFHKVAACGLSAHFKNTVSKAGHRLNCIRVGDLLDYLKLVAPLYSSMLTRGHTRGHSLELLI